MNPRLQDQGPLQTRIAEVWLRDGIIEFRYRAEAHVSLEDAVELMEKTYHELLQQTGPYPALVVFGQAISGGQDVRKYFAESEMALKVQSYAAIVMNSPAGRILGNFIFKVTRPKIPTRLFTDEPAALAWLKQF